MLYDKRGYPINEGDILKVFHFIGSRKKKHFMYKQVGSYALMGGPDKPYLMVHHLPYQEPKPNQPGYYILFDDERTLTDYEIIAGHGPDDIVVYTDRKRKK